MNLLTDYPEKYARKKKKKHPLDPQYVLTVKLINFWPEDPTGKKWLTEKTREDEYDLIEDIIYRMAKGHIDGDGVWFGFAREYFFVRLPLVQVRRIKRAILKEHSAAEITIERFRGND